MGLPDRPLRPVGRGGGGRPGGAAARPSQRRAREALPDGGSVLDVGAGGGAASLPLCPPASPSPAVDQSAGMLAAFAGLAEKQGVAHREVEGLWPAVAGDVGPADVVVCHHVLYNVGDLVPFVLALTDHARRRVVVEITADHPQSASTTLWLHFHGNVRPTRPTAADAAAVLRDLGFDVGMEELEAAPAGATTTTGRTSWPSPAAASASRRARPGGRRRARAAGAAAACHALVARRLRGP